MLLPTRLASLAVAALLVVAAAADAATFYFPETEPASEHKPVAAQLEALGITRFTPPTNHAGDLWSLVASHHSEIDLVWSAHAEAPPLDKLTFATPFRPKINHVPGSDARLTDNDAFHQHIRDSQRKKDLFFFVPSHHVLPRDQAEMPKVFAETAKRVENNLKREDDAFIYQRFLVREQPANGNEESLTAASMITNNDELLAAINAHPQGKSVEVTQYIEPYLIDGHKFQLGFYVVVASVDPLRIYSYGHPQIRIAKTAYPTRLKKDTDKSAYNFNDYIAPWDFPDLQKLYYEYPSTDRTGTNAWTVLKRYMLLHGLDTTRLQKEIDAAIVTSIVSSRGYFQAKIRKFGRSAPAPGDEHKDHTELDESFFELMRFDFEVEDLGKPWLMRIHSNPSMAPHTTVFGSDEAVKKSLLFDLFNLVGVHPQAKPAFDEVFVHADNKFCTAKCQDDVTRTWDATCWSCPGGFAPYVARRLFDAKNEYARRGAFKLVYPSMDQDFTKVLDNPMSEYDLAFTRYIKSLSTAYADTAPQDVSVYNHVLVCTHREHCSSHGDCVNGKCVCDDEYEGATCYIPKDLDREKSLIEERAAADKRAKESWMGNLWKRVPVPAPMEAASVAERVKHNNKAPAKPQQLSQPSDGGVSGGTIFGLLFVGTFAYGGYQVYVSKYGAGGSNKSN